MLPVTTVTELTSAFPVNFQTPTLFFENYNVQGKWGSARIMSPTVESKRKRFTEEEKVVTGLVGSRSNRPPAASDSPAHSPSPTAHHCLATHAWP